MVRISTKTALEKKDQGREPVLVTFFEGLIGPGEFVWAGNSSP
jgi:hypothetical protein